MSSSYSSMTSHLHQILEATKRRNKKISLWTFKMIKVPNEPEKFKKLDLEHFHPLHWNKVK